MTNIKKYLKDLFLKKKIVSKITNKQEENDFVGPKISVKDIEKTYEINL